ncbi:MAG: dTMP kinase [Methanotrichaceae archaeon]|nr:dTMP kinase [Methanotrichaceae archaeon]
MRGILITLEGIDGSGKTTVASILTHKLPEARSQRHFVFTAEPTIGEAGKLLRSHLADKSHDTSEEISRARRIQELSLFMADHADHLAKTVIHELDKGSVVISDRYADSTTAYQGVTLRGIIPEPLDWIRDIYRPWNVVPDRTLFFSVEPMEAIRRLRARENMEKFERLEFLKEVDSNFRKITALEPERFVTIDAQKESDRVVEDALDAILEIIG